MLSKDPARRPAITNVRSELMIKPAELHGGDIEIAGKMREAALRKFPGSVLLHSVGAVIAALKNDAKAATEEIERTEQMRRQYGHFHHCEFDLACALAVLDHRKDALDYLTSAARNGVPCVAAIENDPLLTSVRDDDRYRRLIGELRQTRDHFAQVWRSLKPRLTSFS